MLQKIKNLIAHYRKKCWIYLPFYFSRIRGKKTFIANYYGIPLLMYADTHYQHHILLWQRHGWYEPHILEEWKKLCEGKNCILDVGGYNGLFGIIAAKLNPDAKVFIFEPDEINFRHTSKNIELNNLANVKVLKIAISDKDGEVIFGGHAGGTGPHIGAGTNKVKTITIDSFLKENSIKPDLMKIDVEGAEFLLFEGGKEFFSGSANPQILLEVHPVFLKNFNSSDEELFAKINSYGRFERRDLGDRRERTYTINLQKW